jgi:hypothetical protein
MSTPAVIMDRLSRLSQRKQDEVLRFAEYLLWQAEEAEALPGESRLEADEWSAGSLAAVAGDDPAEEPHYAEDDIIERFSAE